jgi:dTDP-4-dehydrorhamnose 3,5-epimerase-like enzyme
LIRRDDFAWSKPVKPKDIPEFKIEELRLIIPKRFGDARGYFQETWSDRVYRDAAVTGKQGQVVSALIEVG